MCMAHPLKPNHDIEAMNEYAERESVRLLGVRWHRKNWEGNRGLRVLFRKLGQDDKEHWLNNAAAVITSSPWESPPFSNNVHTEGVLDVAPGRTFRIGTMYQVGARDPKPTPTIATV